MAVNMNTGRVTPGTTYQRLTAVGTVPFILSVSGGAVQLYIGAGTASDAQSMPLPDGAVVNLPAVASPVWVKGDGTAVVAWVG